MHGGLGFFPCGASARDSFAPEVPLHLEVSSVRSNTVKYLLLRSAKLGLDVEDLLVIDASHTLIYLIRCRLKRRKRIIDEPSCPSRLALSRRLLMLRMLLLMAVNRQLDALSHLLKPLAGAVSRPTIGSPVAHRVLHHVPLHSRLLMALVGGEPATRARISGARAALLELAQHRALIIKALQCRLYGVVVGV